MVAADGLKYIVWIFGHMVSHEPGGGGDVDAAVMDNGFFGNIDGFEFREPPGVYLHGAHVVAFVLIIGDVADPATFCRHEADEEG